MSLPAIGTQAGATEVDTLQAKERARLVRLCTRLTGDLDAAEDVAQEALLVAWRQEHRLCDPGRRWPWLAGIARNLCLHWARRRQRERAHLAAPRWLGDFTVAQRAEGGVEQLADDFNLQVELERSELATLLDRAMALLPPDTRRVLVERYLQDSPQARTALRLGLSEGAVAMRLARGRLALRRILAAELREEAVAFGLIDPEREAWQATRIWCPVCGQRRLWGRFGPRGYLHIVCRGCFGRLEYCMTEGRFGRLLDGVKGYKPAYNRIVGAFYESFRRGIGGRLVPCPRCGTGVPLTVSQATALGSDAGHRELQRACPHCGPVSGPGSVAGLTVSTPAGRAFWREQGRVRTLPQRDVEAAGVPALVSTMESVCGGARLDVVFARETLEVIAIHGAPQRPLSER